MTPPPVADYLIFRSLYISELNLTLSDTGFFGLQKYGEGGGTFAPPSIPILVLEQQWCSNVVSSFTSRRRVHKNIQNYESTQVNLWGHSCPYMVFFCLCSPYESCYDVINTSWSQLWRYKHVIIALTNKYGSNKRLLMWGM